MFVKTLLSLLFLSTLLSAQNININNEVKEANAEGKQLFVLLHKTDCGYCESFIQFTLDDRSVKTKLSNEFIEVHLNVHHKGTIIWNNFKGTLKEFAIHINRNFYPTSVFFDDHANIILTRSGYIEEKPFFKLLTKAQTKLYCDTEELK